MKNMTKNQHGITFIGVCFVLAIIAFFVLITLRLFPLYNEKLTVISAMESVANRPGITEDTDVDVMKQFVKTAQVGGSNRFNSANVREYIDIEKPREKGGHRIMTIVFETRNKFFSDIYFVLDFNHSVELKGAGSGG